VFNFCAIPQTMAMATLTACFMNPQVFQRNVKIRKAEAARLIMRSTNPREVAYMFRDYARVIHNRALPSDPNFLRLSVACGRIEQWCEHKYPSFVRISSTKGVPDLDASDVRSKVVLLEKERADALTLQKRVETLQRTGQAAAALGPNEDITTGELMLYVGGVLGAIIGLCLLVVWLIVRYSD